jgi:hypothetical protein
MLGSIRWIYSGTGTTTPHIPNDPIGHGTCVASKATGYLFGAAKKANLVAVKIELSGRREMAISTLRALALVAIDIRDEGLRGMAVVNLASSIGQPARDTGNLSPCDLGFR